MGLATLGPVRAVTLLILLLATACTEAAPDRGPTTVTGVVTGVESTGLNEVTQFDLRHEGETDTIFIDEDVDYGFPIGHLREHMSSGEPVRVETSERDGKLYAQSIEDV